MKDYGFIRTAAAVPAMRLADPAYNAEEICMLMDIASQKEVTLMAFPELSLTGATCGDLFTNERLLKGAEEGIRKIVRHSATNGTAVIVGAPVRHNGRIYDCAAVIKDGSLCGLVPKICCNGSSVFSSGENLTGEESDLEILYAGEETIITPQQIFIINDVRFAVEIGEDLYSPLPPSSYHAVEGAQIIVNPAATAEILYTDIYRKNLLSQHSARTHTGYIHVSTGLGESSTDMVYAGAASIWENGDCLTENTRFCDHSNIIIADIDAERLATMRVKDGIFGAAIPGRHKGSYIIADTGDSRISTDFSKELKRHVEPHPFSSAMDLDYRCREILDIQTAGLVRRMGHIGCGTAVLGISGGLDSTLALLVAVMAFDRLGWSRERIIGVTMPGYGTTSRTRNNATDLMDSLGITSREISIVAACDQHFKDLGHDKSTHDVTFENSQARERTQILMDVANQTNGLVIGTGDLSELALGWATYNGDHMSMYGVNAGVPKTLVRSIVKWAAENRFDNTCRNGERGVREILLDIVDTPISPELLPADEKGEIRQVTEDLVGPYELHDFFIYNFMRNGFDPEKILFLAKKAFCSCPSAYDEETIKKWLKTFIRRFFNQQFKRSCLPDGPMTGSVTLSPRGGWKMPSDAWSTFFSSDL